MLPALRLPVTKCCYLIHLWMNSDEVGRHSCIRRATVSWCLSWRLQWRLTEPELLLLMLDGRLNAADCVIDVMLRSECAG